MGSKQRATFVCQQCGAQFPKWAGRCEACSSWNSLIEQLPTQTGNAAVFRSKGKKLSTTSLSDVKDTGLGEQRLLTGIGDLDAVLGGGIVVGSVVLLAGQPGIGKSTILSQVAACVGKTHSVLYISGEESVAQVANRVERLGIDHERILFASTTSADDIAATIRSGQHQLVVVDSMQTIALAELTSAPGSVSQITNAANVLIQASKTK